jgi:fatty acid synthase
MVQKGSGRFEVVEGGAAIVSGVVRVPANISCERASLKPYEPCYSDELLELSPRDIYKELRLRGYNYQGAFRGLVSLDSLGECQ